MEPPTPSPAGGRCSCSCSCCCSSPSPSPSPWPRSVKRKLDFITDLAASPIPATDVARVEVETEVAALRELLATHQQSIQELYEELEEERNASATAANETMSMILRIQREKAEVLLESRQFKRFAEEKMAHDQQELAILEDLLFKRDQALQSLSFEIQAYRHRLISYGIEPPSEPQTPDSGRPQFDLPDYDYPPLLCTTADCNIDPDTTDDYATNFEKYAFGETPHAGEDIQSLEHRIRQLEATTTTTTTTTSSNVMESGVQSGKSSHRPEHIKTSSSYSYGQELKKEDQFPVTVDRASDEGGDDKAIDRVYTIDAVHGPPIKPTSNDEYTSTQREPEGGEKDVARRGGEVDEGEGDIKKLSSRLQALEADRESMRQAIIVMRTEKAQLLLLREIAQQLCMEVKPERRVVKKPSLVSSFSIVGVIKWIVSFLFWRRKASQSKYMFGLSKNNAGLLLLLDKSTNMSQWRCLRRTPL